MYHSKIRTPIAPRRSHFHSLLPGGLLAFLGFDLFVADVDFLGRRQVALARVEQVDGELLRHLVAGAFANVIDAELVGAAEDDRCSAARAALRSGRRAAKRP